MSAPGSPRHPPLVESPSRPCHNPLVPGNEIASDTSPPRLSPEPLAWSPTAAELMPSPCFHTQTSDLATEPVVGVFWFFQYPTVLGASRPGPACWGPRSAFPPPVGMTRQLFHLRSAFPPPRPFALIHPRVSESERTRVPPPGRRSIPRT